jgi:hypothetical protein
MAVTAADLTAPTGELQTAWFVNLPGNLAIWLAQGALWVPEGADSEKADAVVTAYVYLRGFRDVLLRAARDPNSLSIDKGDISISFTDGQRKLFAEQVDKWEAELSAATAVTAVIDNAPRPSRSVAFNVAF